MTNVPDVWFVSAGDYSDYRILCACPSKKEANALAKQANATSDGYARYRVESVPVFDSSATRFDTLDLQVHVLADGTASDVLELSRAEWPFDALYPPTDASWRYVRLSRSPKTGTGSGRLEVWGSNHELVRKVFGDKRAELMSVPMARGRNAQGRIPWSGNSDGSS